MTQAQTFTVDDVAARLRPGREIKGVVAVLMPFDAEGRPDLAGFERQLARMEPLGLRAAVNMDTGYVQLLSPEQRATVLATAQRHFGARPGSGAFVAGAFVEAGEGSLADRYRRQMDRIEEHGGTPILFPCPELRGLEEREVVALFRDVAKGRRDVLLFELGEMFVPYGRIFGLDAFRALLEIPEVSGLKHSSLDRSAEWARLALRDERRPDFRVYTGNDLAIDMVMYGSDYLLGLAAFHPEAFALRDRLWAARDARFYALNDALQLLGAFAFRAPVPGYRHDAAMFLKLRGLIASDRPPAGAVARPESDREILAGILDRLRALGAG
jgi:dihydrodipicolinate synthase/N-acetylneuraminate lyase